MKNDGPRISVIVPTYNRAHLVTRAIDSALRAVSPGDEIIVVDDGSTDQTEDVLRRYDGKIRYIRTENRGAGAARNEGLHMAKHEWIAFLDSDDEWIPDHLDLHRAFLPVSGSVLFSFSNFDICHDDSPEMAIERMQLVSWTEDLRDWREILGEGVPYSQLCELPPGRNDFMVYTGNLYILMFRAPYVSVLTSLVRREIAGRALQFPEDVPTFEDYDCLSRLTKLGDAAYLDCSTAINHGHAGVRLTGVDMLTKVTTRIVITERIWGSDPEYLDKHRTGYEAFMGNLKAIRARELIKLGYTKEAREELANLVNAPLPDRMLSLLPGFAARSLYRIWRCAKAGRNGSDQ